MAYFTHSCSGCFESEDGHPVGEYPWDDKAKCYVGAGCKECGYTGKRRTYFDARPGKVICSVCDATDSYGSHPCSC
jgi:hypothetical protein